MENRNLKVGSWKLKRIESQKLKIDMRKLNIGEDWKSEFEGWMLKGIEDWWLKEIESWDWKSKTEGKYKIGNWKLEIESRKYNIYNL